MLATVNESIDLLLPQHLPRHISIGPWLAGEPQYDAVRRFQEYSAQPLTSAEMASGLAELLRLLPSTGLPIVDLKGPQDEMAHDAYFRVRRVVEAPEVFLRSLLSARHTFLKEVNESGVTISHQELNHIDRAFADLLSCLFGATTNADRHVNIWGTTGLGCDAMQRWIKGHTVFAVLTQGLIFSIRALDHSLHSGLAEEIRRWADLTISLFLGSKGAFLFTGDFAASEYENAIRPSMSPPAAPICLSGLMSADHRYLSRIMRGMGPALKSLAEQEPDRYDQIVAALNGVYDSHVHVCERFVGTSPSLLTEGRTERSGPSLIEQFRTLRLKPFELEPDSKRFAGNQTRPVPGGCPFHA